MSEACHITRGLDGWRQCVDHGWEGHEDELRRIRVCPAATPPSPAPGLPLDEERLATVLRPWLGIRSEKELAYAVRSIAADYARLAADAATDEAER